MWFGLLGVAAAQGSFASDPAELLFTDLVDLFGVVSVDTGYLPSQSSPISVRFHVTPTGGVVSELEAVSELAWPAAYQQTLHPMGGWFGIDTHIDLAFDVHINVASIYQNSLSVWTESFSLTQIADFETLLLPGSPEAPVGIVVDQPGLIDPFTYLFQVVPGVAGLSLAVEVYPQLSTQLAGNRVESTLAGVTATQDGEGGFLVLDPPAGRPASVDVRSTYFADLATVFSLVIRPSASLDTVIGDFELLAFDIPIDLLGSEDTRAFQSDTATHPLPVLFDPVVGTDFGVVELAHLANLEVPLTNLGELGLEGTAHIEGSDAFRVYPTYFYAAPGRTDGVVVSFSPLDEGEQLATLVLTSNDPTAPSLRIPLSGSGGAVSVPQPTGPAPTDSTIRGCGCAVGGAGGGGWALLGLVAVAARRRWR